MLLVGEGWTKQHILGLHTVAEHCMSTVLADQFFSPEYFLSEMPTFPENSYVLVRCHLMNCSGKQRNTLHFLCGLTTVM